MIRKLTLSLAALAAAGTMTAQDAQAPEPAITIIEGQMMYGGMMPQCISANAKYICGSTYMWAGFISEWQEQNSKVYLDADGSSFAEYGCDLPFISNDGVALGFDDLGALLIDFTTGSVQRPRIAGLPDSMTEDGSIIVGMSGIKVYSEYITPHNIDSQATYWENGKLNLLPVPTEEELGYYILGSRARCVSADGSVIMGELIDRLSLRPLVVWLRQADGSYEIDPVCMEYFSDIKYNEGYYRDYVVFRGNAMSRNGEWVAMTLRDAPEYEEPATAPNQLGLYNIRTRELRKAQVSEDTGIGLGYPFEVYYNGVSDNGTVVGFFTNEMEGEGGFIMYSDEMQPVSFLEAFPTIGQFADYAEWGFNRVSAITPDGRYLTGMGYAETLQFGGIYEAWVLDLGIDDTSHSGVETVGVDEAQDAPAVYYNLQGARVANPGHGIFIKVTGDKSEKVVM